MEGPSPVPLAPQRDDRLGEVPVVDHEGFRGVKTLSKKHDGGHRLPRANLPGKEIPVYRDKVLGRGVELPFGLGKPKAQRIESHLGDEGHLAVSPHQNSVLVHVISENLPPAGPGLQGPLVYVNE